MQSTLNKHIEAIIFCAPSPVKPSEIAKALTASLTYDITEKEVKEVMSELQERYTSEDFAFEIVNVAGGYQFMTKSTYRNTTSAFLQNRSKKKLTKSALETLSIIAYKQPVNKTEIEQIRGVGSDYVVKKLLEKGLIEIKGKSDAIGRPLLYGTTQRFLEYFGLNRIDQLPSPKEFSDSEQSIGEESAT